MKKSTGTIEQNIAEGNIKGAHDAFAAFLIECEKERDQLLLSQSRMAILAHQETLGVGVSQQMEQNKIAWDFLSQLRRFRREVLEQFFDIQDKEEYLKHITDRDLFIQQVLELRLQPKNFQIEELLAEGNSSIVYRLLNIALNRHAVALVLKLPKLTDQSKSEIAGFADLRHRNIVHVLDYDLSSYPYFVINEYIYGPTLIKALETAGPRPVAQAADWMYQLTDALDYLRHKRIFHTNVRPSKIFVDDEWQLVISPVDMHTIATGEPTYNRFIDVCRYASPEYLREFGKPITAVVDTPNLKNLRLSDQYALGLIGFKILTGEALFKGQTAYEIMESRKRFTTDKVYRQSRLDSLPDASIKSAGGKEVGFKTIIERLLQEQPEDRFEDLRKVLHILHAFTRASYEIQSLCHSSYRRCLACNKEFIRDFYALFFQRAPHTKADFSEIGKKRQLGMLQMAIDVLLDIDHKKDQFLAIIGRQSHGKYSLLDFEVFIDVLIETVRANDPLFEGSTSEQWSLLRDKMVQVIREHLESRK